MRLFAALIVGLWSCTPPPDTRRDAVADGEWATDSTYSEMDQAWSYFAAVSYPSDRDSALTVVGLCTPAGRRAGASVYLDLPDGVERSDGDRVAVRIRASDSLVTESWYWISDAAWSPTGTAFLRDLAPPGRWVEVPSARSGPILYKISDAGAVDVADWLDVRCPTPRPGSAP